MYIITEILEVIKSNSRAGICNRRLYAIIPRNKVFEWAGTQMLLNFSRQFTCG
jgi:hypothetical protein